MTFRFSGVSSAPFAPWLVLVFV